VVEILKTAKAVIPDRVQRTREREFLKIYNIRFPFFFASQKIGNDELFKSVFYWIATPAMQVRNDDA
jgi:hypothetical protein